MIRATEQIGCGIDMKKADFSPNVAPEKSERSSEARTDLPSEQSAPVAGNSIVAAVMGLAMSVFFYAIVLTVPWEPLQRYFNGHPVAVAATVLFWFGTAVLVSKMMGIAAQNQQLATIRDEDLLPTESGDTPAQKWLEQNDAGHVARSWVADLERLPSSIRNSHLVYRLNELLVRQSQRGTTKHLADDLREVSARDADAAHDSLGLVRIIVWAIPMLGFLGTVIGITQTLGGLDFSNGTAAVDSLKGGLYVAFDTTALGLVLSVIAIFIQFPIERSEQRLLATIDARVGYLMSASLPSDEASDNQTALIADLCQGVQAAVAESLDNQAKLWRDTIDTAQQQWQSVHEVNNNQIADAFETILQPALYEHAKCIGETTRVTGDHLRDQCERWQASVEQSQSLISEANTATTNNILNTIDATLSPLLREHASSMNQCQQQIVSQQQTLVQQVETLTQTNQQAESIAAMQLSLDSNLQRLAETNVAINRSVTAAAAGDGMADAMRILARAVDVLSDRLADERQHQGRQDSSVRRAA
ncbi:MAG: MotA/TolQ/ExbB proton channel family protein [Rubripirellula sp.]